MTSQPVTYAVSDGVAVITLSRPEARNAIDSTLAAGLIDAFTRAESAPEVGAIVVTGADPAFCAGVDLKEFTRLQRPPARASEAIVMAGKLTKPALGAINGPVMTGGLELALGLDLLIASERARFADTHAAVGILPGGGMTARLPRAVGARMAMEMSYTGRVIDAAIMARTAPWAASTRRSSTSAAQATRSTGSVLSATAASACSGLGQIPVIASRSSDIRSAKYR